MDKIDIIDTHEGNILDFGVCGYKSIKRPGYPEKIEWLKARFQEGLKIKTLFSEQGGVQGMIEYIPGERCWRPVNAKGYMFIHCIFTGFKKEYKNKGYGSLLLGECIKDAKENGSRGIAVVTRKGAFMAGKKLFLKHGFHVVDVAGPDFELLVKTLNTHESDVAAMPTFKGDWEKRIRRYADGLTIIRAAQCPYTVKNVNEICETAKTVYGIRPHLITLNTAEEAQDAPGPFGSFSLIHNGVMLAHHPISKKRFMNIMDKTEKKSK